MKSTEYNHAKNSNRAGVLTLFTSYCPHPKNVELAVKPINEHHRKKLFYHSTIPIPQVINFTNDDDDDEYPAELDAVPGKSQTWSTRACYGMSDSRNIVTPAEEKAASKR